jgi:hypothetical protein
MKTRANTQNISSKDTLVSKKMPHPSLQVQLLLLTAWIGISSPHPLLAQQNQANRTKEGLPPHIAALLKESEKDQQKEKNQTKKKQRSPINLPIKIYTLQFEGAPSLDGETKNSEIGSTVLELNDIFRPTGIQWRLSGSGPIRIKHNRFYDEKDGFGIVKDSQSIRYKLSQCIDMPTERGTWRIFLLKRFPRGEADCAFYDERTRSIFAAENTSKWGKLHSGLLAHSLGTTLGLSKTDASGNMMFRLKPKSKLPEDNKLYETQILRTRQIADIELAAKRKEDGKQGQTSHFPQNQSNTTITTKPQNIPNFVQPPESTKSNEYKEDTFSIFGNQ